MKSRRLFPSLQIARQQYREEYGNPRANLKACGPKLVAKQKVVANTPGVGCLPEPAVRDSYWSGGVSRFKQVFAFMTLLREQASTLLGQQRHARFKQCRCILLLENY